MPFYLRQLEPVNLGRKVTDLADVLSIGEQNSLVDSKEEYANRTLSNIIRQLASLGRHAGDIFQVLEYEAQILEGRTIALQEKTNQVQAKLEVRLFKAFTLRPDAH